MQSGHELLPEERREKLREYARNYYHRNKDQQRARNKGWRTKHAEWIKKRQRDGKRQRKIDAITYLGGKCLKCSGEFHPSVFEFHHRDPSTKDADPSKALMWSWPRLKEELDKCDLLCANCHRLTHHDLES